MEENKPAPSRTLEERIKDAKQDYIEEYVENEEQNDDEDDENEKRSTRAGSEMLASIFAGGLIGYGIDWGFSIAPWGLLSFMVLGFISGVYRANATMDEQDEKPEQ